MNSEPRTVELSTDNYHSAIETFLRSMKEIRNEENVTLVVDNNHLDINKFIKIQITPQASDCSRNLQEVNTDQPKQPLAAVGVDQPLTIH